MISGRAVELSQRRTLTDLRNTSRDPNGIGNGVFSAAAVFSVTPKVSFERDFPLLGSDERLKTSDFVRVPLPRLSNNLKDLSVGTSSLIGNEDWTLALADEHVGVAGSNKVESSLGPLPIHAADGVSVPVSVPSSSAAASNGFNMLKQQFTLLLNQTPFNSN